MSRPLRFTFLAFLMLLVAGTAAIVFATAAKSQQFDRYQYEIERLQAQLTQTKLSSEDRKSGERKLEIAIDDATRMAAVYLEWTQEAAGLITSAPTSNYIPATEDPKSVSRLPDGIDDHPIVLRPIPSGYDLNSIITNSWRKTTPERTFFVYAGYLKDDPKQGMVLSRRPDRIFMDQFLTPKKSGAVRIVAEHGFYLVLEAENGDLFYFDPVRQSFIASLKVPTVTPLAKSLLTTPAIGTPYP